MDKIIRFVIDTQIVPGLIESDYKHYACVLKKKRVLAIGTNHVIFDSYNSSIHAENDVITKFKRINKFRRYIKKSDSIDILVFRLTKTGVLGYSRPCKTCIDMLLSSNFNIRKIYYSTSNGNFTSEKLSEMLSSTSTKYSSGTRKRFKSKQ